jgi:hypothetical protein
MTTAAALEELAELCQRSLASAERHHESARDALTATISDRARGRAAGRVLGDAGHILEGLVRQASALGRPAGSDGGGIGSAKAQQPAVVSGIRSLAARLEQDAAITGTRWAAADQSLAASLARLAAVQVDVQLVFGTEVKLRVVLCFFFFFFFFFFFCFFFSPNPQPPIVQSRYTTNHS